MGMVNSKGSFSGNENRLTGLVTLGLLVLTAFVVLAPTGVNADVQPGGTLINDFPAEARYRTSWWRTEDPDYLQFKIPTEDDAYTAVCIQNRLSGEDYDIFVYTDYEMTQKIGSSTKGSNEYDIVIIDGHTYGGGYKYGKVFRFSGTDWNSGIRIESDYHKDADDLYGTDPDYDGPLEVGRYQYSEFEYHSSGYSGSLEEETPMINMYDIYLDAGGQYDFDMTSIPSSMVLNTYLFKGSSNMENVLAQDESTGAGDTSLSFSYEPDTSGWYGLLVLDENRAYTSLDNYTILISSYFDLTCTPSSNLIAPGMNASYQIDVGSLGITKDIDLSYTWWNGASNISTPSGAQASLSSSSVSPGGVSTNSVYLNVTTTSGLAAGTYYLKVWGNDTGHGASDNKENVEMTLKVSTDPDFFISSTPDLNMTNPGGTTKFTVSMDTINDFNDNVTLSATSSPTTSDLSFSFSPSQINSSSTESVLTITASSDISPGLYNLTISGTNGTITRTSTTSSVRIYDPIDMEIITPQSGEIVSGVYTFKVEAGTPATVKEVDLTFKGTMSSVGTIKMYYDSSSGFWERTINTYPYNDGSFSINITAKELGGGITYLSSGKFMLSNSAPNPVINSPLDMSYVTGSSMAINVNTSILVNSVRFRIDNNAWTSMARSSSTWTGTWDTTIITDGKHTLTVEAKDSAGLTGQSAVTIYVDNNLPTCTINSPINGQYIQGDYTFRVVATDTVGVNYVNITIFGETTTLPYNPITSSYEYTVSTGTRADGIYNAQANAYDYVGQMKSSTQITFYIDNNDPTLSIDSPADGGIIGSDYTISATSSDIFLNKVEYRVDSTGWQNMTGSDPSWSVVLNTSQLTDGNHILSIRSIDNASHVTQQSIDFVVDNTNPTCNVVSPFDGLFIEGVYTFKVSSSDSVGIDRVMLNVFSDDVQMTFNRQNGNYEYTFNTLTVADGNYTTRARSYDLSGKYTDSSVVSFKVDNQAPEMTIKDLQTGDYVDGSVLFSVEVNDAFPKDTMYSVDGGSWVNITTVWNTSLLLDGKHTVTFRARDQAGHSTTQSMDLWVDNNAPVCAVNSPVEDEYIESAYTFRVSASDSVGIYRVYVNVFGNNLTTTFSAASGYYEYTTDTSIRSDGNYTARAYVYDLSGKMTESAFVSFHIDNNAPEMTIKGLQTGDYVEGDVTFSVEVTDTFPKDTMYSVDGGAWVSITTAWNTSLLLDGKHTVTFRARDQAGHITTQSMDLWVDNNAPVCAVNSPVEDEYIESAYTFRVSASDSVGIYRVYVNVFGNNLTTTFSAASGYYEYTTDTSIRSDGNYTARAYVYDLSGKMTESISVSFHIDNNAPEMTVNDLQNGNYVGGSVEFNITVSDVFLKDVRYSIDGGAWRSMSTPWDTTLLLDGRHTIHLQARDRSGHTTSQEIWVTVDNHDPSCSVNSPAAEEYVEGVYTFRISATDQVGIDKVEINIFGKNYVSTYSSSTGYYEFTMDTSLVSDGTYYCTASVLDLSGKSNISSSVEFQVDNNAPVLRLVNPLPGDYIEGRYNLSVNVTDLFINRTEYNVDGTGWVDLSVPLNTSLFGDGDHMIQIRAVDDAGHITTANVDVVIDNNNPYGSISYPASGAYITEETPVFKVVASDLVGLDSVTIELDFPGFEGTLPMSYNTGTGYWEFRTDISLVPDGTYNVTILVLDLSGKRTILGPRQFNIDNHVPEIIVNGLASGDILSGSSRLIIFSRDTFLKEVRYKVDENEPIPLTYSMEGGWANATFLFDTTAFPDGMHKLMIMAVDEAGQESRLEFSIFVDNIAPTCTITSPVQEEFVEGVITIKVTAYDIVGIDHVMIKVYDLEARVPFNAQTGYYEYSSNTITWGTGEDGRRNVTAIAYDRTGKSYTYGPVDFNVDNRPPSVIINAPLEGQVVSGTDFDIDVINGDVFSKATEYNIDGASWQAVSIPWDTTRVMDGEHRITIKATDQAGHVTYETLNVIVDNHAPQVEIASPSPNEYMEGTYTFKVIASDEVGIKSSTIIAAGRSSPISYNIQTGYYEFTMDTRGLSDGTHVVNATVVDAAGRRVTTPNVQFNVDNHFPTLTVDAPVKGEMVSDSYVIVAYTNDVFPGPVKYAIDGTTWYDKTTPWDTTGVRDGNHIVTIKTTDKAGHETTFDIQVVVDNSPPVISQASIASGQILSGIQTLRFYAVDAIGIREVRLQIDNGSSFEIFKSESGMYYEHLIDTRTYLDGSHTMTLWAMDLSGNEVSTEYRINLDNTGPDIDLDYYWIEGDMQTNEGEVKEGRSVVFRAKVTDPSGVSSVMINIDSSGWREMTPDSSSAGKDTYVLYWPTAGAGSGAHIFQIRTSDRLGNERTSSGMINIKEVEEKETFAERLFEGFQEALPILWFLLFIVLIIALFILGYLGVLTRWAKGEGPRKKEPSEEDKDKKGPGETSGKAAGSIGQKTGTEKEGGRFPSLKKKSSGEKPKFERHPPLSDSEVDWNINESEGK